MMLLGLADAGEELAVGLQRKQHAHGVDRDQDHGEAEAERLHHLRPLVSTAHQRGHEQGDGGEKEQRRLEAGADAIELLQVMFETAEQEGAAEHEQRVGDDGAGDRGLDQQILPRLQGGQRYDEFGEISERGVQ